MPEAQNTMSSPLFLTIDLLVSLLVAGAFLLFTLRIRKRFPPFASLLFAITCLCASPIPIAFLQLISPPLDSLLGRLTPLLVVATCGITGSIRFARARYREEVQSLGLFLVLVVCLAMSVLLLLQMVQLGGSHDFLAIGAAGMLIGAITIIPHRYFRRFLEHLFTGRSPQPQPGVQQHSPGPALRAALSLGVMGLGGLAFLWYARRLGFFVPSLPIAGATSAWIFFMDAFVLWLTTPRPLPAYWPPPAATTTNPAHPLTTDQS